MNMTKETIAWKVIGEPLDQILITLENKIERDWPHALSAYGGSREIVLFTFKVAKNTYSTMRWICADKPHYDDRKLEYSVAVPPLARTIVDNIFTLIFLSEDVPKRSQWYYKSGWRELKEEFDRYQSKYSKDHNWTDWLKSFQKNLELSKKPWGIDETEEKDLKKIKWWPTPPKMLKDYPFGNPETKVFLQFLNDWFYKELSSASHLNLPGLMKAGLQLVQDQSDTDQREKLLGFKSNCVTTTVTLILALISEIEILARFGLQDRITYIWGVLIQYWSDAKELYDIRYAELLRLKSGYGPTNSGALS